MTADVFAAADGPKRRPGLALAARNRRILAERLGWPAGALQECERLEREHPGWHVSWLPENTTPRFERPEGWWGVYDGTHHRVEVFRPTAAALKKRMAEGVPDHEFGLRGCRWCVEHPVLGGDRVKL